MRTRKARTCISVLPTRSTVAYDYDTTSRCWPEASVEGCLLFRRCWRLSGHSANCPIMTLMDVEGRNIEFVQRHGDGRMERLPDLGAELVRLKVDVIVTGSNLHV